MKRLSPIFVLTALIVLIVSSTTYAISLGTTAIATTSQSLNAARRSDEWRLVNGEYNPVLDMMIAKKPVSYDQIAYTDRYNTFYLQNVLVENRVDDDVTYADRWNNLNPDREYYAGQEFDFRDHYEYQWRLDLSDRVHWGQSYDETYNELLDKNRMAILRDSCPIAESTDHLAFVVAEKTHHLTENKEENALNLSKYRTAIPHAFKQFTGSSKQFEICGMPMTYLEFLDPETGELIRYWLHNADDMDRVIEEYAFPEDMYDKKVSVRIVTIQPYIDHQWVLRKFGGGLGDPSTRKRIESALVDIYGECVDLDLPDPLQNCDEDERVLTPIQWGQLVSVLDRCKHFPDYEGCSTPGDPVDDPPEDDKCVLLAYRDHPDCKEDEEEEEKPEDTGGQTEIGTEVPLPPIEDPPPPPPVEPEDELLRKIYTHISG